MRRGVAISPEEILAPNGSSSGAVRFATHGRCLRRGLLTEVDQLDRQLDRVRLRVGDRRLDRCLLVIASPHRVPAQLRGGDRQHRRAGTPVGERALRLAAIGEVEQQLEAGPGRRMGAGPERPAGIDDDVDRRRLARIPLPGRPHDQPAPADDDGLVEVPPAVGPVVGNLGRLDLDQAGARGGPQIRQVGQLAGWPVDRVLDVVGAALLLDAAGHELDELRQDQLRLIRAAADGQPDHRRVPGPIT